MFLESAPLSCHAHVTKWSPVFVIWCEATHLLTPESGSPAEGDASTNVDGLNTTLTPPVGGGAAVGSTGTGVAVGPVWPPPGLPPDDGVLAGVPSADGVLDGSPP